MFSHYVVILAGYFCVLQFARYLLYGIAVIYIDSARNMHGKVTVYDESFTIH